jgi:DNA-nicking Smr family endonuclease
MKKKKTDGPPQADFRNNPFRSLKGFAPKPEAREKKPAPAPRKEAKPEDESTLFLQAVSGARRIEQEEVPASVTPSQKPAGKKDAVYSEDRNLFLQAMRKIGTTFGERQPEEEDLRPRSPSSRVKQLKRGTLRIGAELDLHGYLRDEALLRLGHFISNAAARDLDAVLVITGKGMNSPEGPVLQGAVSAWLRERGKTWVAEFSPAPRDKGGSGAFVVFLKRGTGGK